MGRTGHTYSNGEVREGHTGVREGLVVDYVPVQNIELVVSHCILQERGKVTADIQIQCSSTSPSDPG